MNAELAELLYAATLRILTPVYLARLWWRGRAEPLYRMAWRERLAWKDPDRVPQTGRLWVHAVSLGETRAAAALIDALRAEQPGLRILLTHSTATGREAGRALLREGDAQAWFPWDTPGAQRRFLAQHRPRLGVMMETEVWPGLLRQAQLRGVPIVLANARLSEKSLRQGLRWRALLGTAATRLRAVLAQTEDDAERLRRMGAPEVGVCGNVKFDVDPPPDLLALGESWAHQSGAELVLAASTRDTEEVPLLQAWKAQVRMVEAAAENVPRLLIVPRHPQRFDAVAALVVQNGFSLSRRSAWPGGQPDAQARAAQVWLGDSLGEMPAYFAAARVALLGGSFAPVGGQNLIEAAACGCPLVMGPSTFNFAQAAEESLSAGAALRVRNASQGVTAALAILDDPEARAAMRRAGLRFTAISRGAARRQARAILALLDPPGDPATHPGPAQFQAF